jgi:hypothetical protein
VTAAGRSATFHDERHQAENFLDWLRAQPFRLVVSLGNKSTEVLAGNFMIVGASTKVTKHEDHQLRSDACCSIRLFCVYRHRNV